MRALVVGGGISGLTAAHRLLRAVPDAEVTVIERRGRLGGLLKSSTLGGVAPEGADIGAEASLFVRPETRALAAELGLEAVFPDPAQSSQIFAHGRMHAMPKGTLMGVPADPDALAGLLPDVDLDRVRNETLTPPAEGDASVGEFLAARLGDALVDAVVDPLLGGVYAGRCRDLSLAATVPALLPALHDGTSVLGRVAEVQEQRRASGSGARGPGANVPGSQANGAPPVFMSLPGGIARIVDALAVAITAAGGRIRTSTAAKSLARTEDGWCLGVTDVTGSTDSADAMPGPSEELGADLVVLAVPAFVSAPLLAGVGDPALRSIAEELSGIEYASSAVVTAVIDTAEAPLTGSGFLVPPVEPAFIKASTFASAKWPWLAAGLPADTAVVRMSVGRFGDTAWADLPDEELAARALEDWRRITGRTAPARHVEVQRWEDALPQYFPGHLEASARIDAQLAPVPGLALVGNVHEGVGIPACLARAESEITRVLGTQNTHR
ncbi:protoporphyrinogen oxidase [Brevibacterium samyangense]|uniref:Coproporphyrinogen III oxidase n=1 Tax=Brevibacterium samyangense TaxID=366888 RepID=A0ABP5EUS0_9MICO